MIKRIWRRVLAFLLIGILIAILALVYWSGSQIASPTRRALMDYHREFLSNPAAHGFQIDKFTGSDGTPCLVCTPAPFGNLGERGIKIRQQLSERGLLLKPSGTVVGTLVLVHGRKGRKEDYLPIAERLCAVGFRCVIPDLPGHGDHPVAVATYGIREAELPARILDEAAAKFCFDKDPVGILGMSMGGSIAIHSAARPAAPWKALAVISSFDSFKVAIENQASNHVGSTLGQLWAEAADAIYQMKSGISITSIQPHLKAATLKLPTLIAHGTADRIVPLSSGRHLFDSLPLSTTKKWILIPGADHDNVLVTSYPIYADIAAWMLQNVAGNVPTRVP